MKKYLQVFKMSFKENNVSYINTILSVISFTVIIYVFVNLWQYIYTNSMPVINGYNFNDMMWYLIAGEVIAISMSGRYIIQGINDDIRSGKIAYILNKPYNYYFYCVVNAMGEILFKYIFLIISGTILGMIFLGFANLSLVMILPVLLSFILSALLCALLYALVGLISFWTEDATPFYWLVSKIFLIFGVFFPPEFFPRWIQPIIQYSPIYSMYSGTSKLIAQFSWDLFFNVTISQVFYIVVFMLIGMYVFKRGTRRVNINGG